MDKRFEAFISTLNIINHSIQAIKNQEMAEYDLKGIYVMCLYYLREHPEGLTSKELATLCGEDKAAISRTLSKIESKNLIKFIDTEGKKRYRTLIKLTEEGKKVCDDISQKIEKHLQINGRGITDEDRKIFYKVLAIIANNLKDTIKN